ncbi:hypothetical protein ANO11243_078720 [Dothideomycetidae sp. 11243]|nr:hypothetical protein ANO11243_078720 [fungal sp. No.11243]
MPAVRQRHSAAASSSGTNPVSRRVELPEYQPAAYKLRPKAQSDLSSLASRHPLRTLDNLLSKAITILSDNVAGINDNYHSNVETLEASKQRLARAPEPSEEERKRLEKLEDELDAMRQKVESLTKRMEQDVRKTIDAQHTVEYVTDTLGELASSASTQSQRPTQRPGLGEDEDEGEGEDESSPLGTFTPTDPTSGTQRPRVQPTMGRFTEGLQRKRDRYSAFTPAQRYSSNNSYRQFRKLLHDAQHPAGDIPVPHESTWFDPPSSSRPAPGETGANTASADHRDAESSDDDLAIARETVSTKCPITLRDFEHPVTSRKCPHSFEESAIMEMISASRLRLTVAEGAEVVLDLSQRRGAARHTQTGGVNAVRCPVPGCASLIAARDLASDAVLVRKIARLQRAARLLEEEDEEDGGRRKRMRDGRSIVPLGSSDVEIDEDDVTGTARRRRLKGERVSGMPSSSRARLGSDEL